MEIWEEIVVQIEKLVAEIYDKPDIKELDVITDGPTEVWGGHYKKFHTGDVNLISEESMVLNKTLHFKNGR